MALAASDLALNQFIEVSDRLSEFEARCNTPSPTPPSMSMLNIRREEVRALWERIKKEYDECNVRLISAGDSAADSLPILRAKYNYCYGVYERCGANIEDLIAQAPRTPQTQADPSQTYVPSGCRLPPCDTEVFTGDYLRWPTFRDLFTAIYINNPRLTPVEKLFHLNSKTSGEAHTIVAKSPLTNDGFRSASSSPRSRPTTTAPATTSAATSTVQNYFATGHRSVLLGTAVIDICHLGSTFKARALIDSGSEATFMTERLWSTSVLFNSAAFPTGASRFFFGGPEVL
ncbi:uncharacterized protein LOC122320679 [Drosophila ficusphila]|uniref:uncharacterized protein LOC122320679 n=1 Tax=Drosophila ficusphila TaxID=30025 RepID=UPI001C8AE74F|nr:uncharacterized protein LOC122320679 [Drosophila ficusphila]